MLVFILIDPGNSVVKRRSLRVVDDDICRFLFPSDSFHERFFEIFVLEVIERKCLVWGVVWGKKWVDSLL